MLQASVKDIIFYIYSIKQTLVEELTRVKEELSAEKETLQQVTTQNEINTKVSLSCSLLP